MWRRSWLAWNATLTFSLAERSGVESRENGLCDGVDLVGGESCLESGHPAGSCLKRQRVREEERAATVSRAVMVRATKESWTCRWAGRVLRSDRLAHRSNLKGSQKMISRITALQRRETWVIEAPTLVISLVVAEVFFKFGSFTLEAVAMLATWWLLSSAAGRLVSWRRDSVS
jgi:hypothetical protein